MRFLRCPIRLGLCLALVAGAVMAADTGGPVILSPYQGQPCPLPFSPTPGQQPGQVPGQVPAPGAGSAAQTDAFARAPEGGTEPAGSYNPTMFGDQFGAAGGFGGGGVGGFVGGTGQIGQFGGSGTTAPQASSAPANSPPVPLVRGLSASALTAYLARGTFKIAENESPRPLDRVFLNYNYFNRTFGGFDLNRETIGFEKTLWDDNSSFGVRLPFFQLGRNGDGEGGQEDVGDLTLIFKYAHINNRETGNVFSSGLVLTLPTGPTFHVPGADGRGQHSTLVQPYIGGIYNIDRLYFHGFSSVVFPTNDRDAILWFNDVAAGYFLYRSGERGRFLTSVVPTFEVHVNDPLNHRGSQNLPVGVPDVVDLTLAMTLGLGERSTLGLGVVAPVTGPKPFSWEGQVQLNHHW
jgi:hypothetical protein